MHSVTLLVSDMLIVKYLVLTFGWSSHVGFESEELGTLLFQVGSRTKLSGRLEHTQITFCSIQLLERTLV